jgi:non-specific serine/threonine protein kinase
MSPIDPRLGSAFADHYRLERALGAGGMATVYLAEDLKHHRKVAVKVLRPEFTAAFGDDRFVREITTTANLRHPNILPLYDSGEKDGLLFYVMPFVDGESLRDRLKREPQLPLDDTLQIAGEVADALNYAHGRGVIHRDIKPENILLENGHALIADFGIAQALTATAAEKLTMTGTVVGTPHYMSPEQARGEAVDARSDIYALGCMVYEMLAGAPPFTGPTAVAVITRHALDPVPPLQTVRPDLAASVVHAVERALSKKPADASPTAVTGSMPTSGIFKPPPTPATPLIGRDHALASAAERLRSGVRVLTITGPGGTGKTRFAIELFSLLQRDYPRGAAFVSLASVTAVDEVMPTVGIALDVAEAHRRSAVDAVATLFGDRRAILFLDNLEQVLDVAPEVALLVGQCPALQVVATSRAPLKIGAETELPLPPLELPAAQATGVEEIRSAPAVALFAQRALRVKPGFAVTSANAQVVAGICRRLDGLPLALELAAARIRILEPAALLTRLEHALDLLTSGDRDLPARQRTLRATVDWSYSLLDQAEQRLLQRASVFSEGWTFAAMEAVCYAAVERHRALDELDSLVEKGLVQVTGSGERYRLLETIREFAAERLDASGEAESVRQAHAEYCLTFASDANAGLRRPGQLDWMRRARAENANTLSAIQWLTARARAGHAGALEQGLLLCGLFNWMWHIGGQHLTARGTVDVVLTLSSGRPPSRGRALALFTAGMVSVNTGESDRALDEWTRAMADALAIGDEPAIAEAGLFMGHVHLTRGRIEEARTALDDSIARSRTQGDEFIQGIAMSILGLLLGSAGDIAGGIELLDQSLAVLARIEDYEGAGVGRSFLAQLSFAKGDPARALEYYGQALHALETIGDHPEVARVHCEMSWTALALNQLNGARRSFREALRTYNEVGSPRGMGLALMGLAAAEAAADAHAAILLKPCPAVGMDELDGHGPFPRRPRASRIHVETRGGIREVALVRDDADRRNLPQRREHLWRGVQRGEVALDAVAKFLPVDRPRRPAVGLRAGGRLLEHVREKNVGARVNPCRKKARLHRPCAQRGGLANGDGRRVEGTIGFRRRAAV